MTARDLFILSEHVMAMHPHAVAMASGPVASYPHPVPTVHNVVRSMDIIRSVLNRDHDAARRRRRRRYGDRCTRADAKHHA